MYQEWDSPPFTADELLELCKDFFTSQNFPTVVESKGRENSILKAHISPINATQTIRIERKGRKIRLAYTPLSHAADGLARLGGLLVTGRAVKAEAQKQLLLDDVERQFWESLDRKIATFVAHTDEDAMGSR